MTPFVPGQFSQKFMAGGQYASHPPPAPLFSRLLPSLSFYSRLYAGPVLWLCRRAAKGLCDDTAWVHASVWVADLMERMGCPVLVDGMEIMDAVDEPCLFVANHMSTLETFMLPAMICPRRPVTFVVKDSLVSMPFFGAVMRSRDPIVVGRHNPRADLNTVFEGGMQRLKQGISLIVFPQSTRATYFDAQHFNSIGVKLARKAGVPIIPLALKTDAWGKGKTIKELGHFKAGMAVRYRFAPPVRVQSQGKEEHAAICHYIEQNLTAWQKEDGVNA